MEPPQLFWLAQPRLKLRPRIDGGDWFVFVLLLALCGLGLVGAAMGVSNLLWWLTGTRVPDFGIVLAPLVGAVLLPRVIWPRKAAFHVYPAGLVVLFPFRFRARSCSIPFAQVQQFRFIELRNGFSVFAYLHPYTGRADRIDLTVDTDRANIETLTDELRGLGLNVLFVEEL
jgi:hypothetical protein